MVDWRTYAQQQQLPRVPMVLSSVQHETYNPTITLISSSFIYSMCSVNARKKEHCLLNIRHSKLQVQNTSRADAHGPSTPNNLNFPRWHSHATPLFIYYTQAYELSSSVAVPSKMAQQQTVDQQFAPLCSSKPYQAAVCQLQSTWQPTCYLTTTAVQEPVSYNLLDSPHATWQPLPCQAAAHHPYCTTYIVNFDTFTLIALFASLSDASTPERPSRRVSVVVCFDIERTLLRGRL